MIMCKAAGLERIGSVLPAIRWQSFQAENEADDRGSFAAAEPPHQAPITDVITHERLAIPPALSPP